MKITFLGTNGWYDTQTGNTSCVFVETDDEYIIFDAGGGFQKARGLINQGKPVYLFISHLHLDHLIGLHTLPLFQCSHGIDLYAPKAFIKPLKGFLRRPFTTAPFSLKTKLRFHALDGKTTFSFGFEMRRLKHSVPCYGYKITSNGRSVAYCTDTGDCACLKRLATGADLLITECAMAPGDTAPKLFHLTPETAAIAAHDAGAAQLALFHFDPGKYPTFDDRRRAEEAAGKIFKNTVAANDGTEIVI